VAALYRILVQRYQIEEIKMATTAKETKKRKAFSQQISSSRSQQQRFQEPCLPMIPGICESFMTNTSSKAIKYVRTMLQLSRDKELKGFLS